MKQDDANNQIIEQRIALATQAEIERRFSQISFENINLTHRVQMLQAELDALKNEAASKPKESAKPAK